MGSFNNLKIFVPVLKLGSCRRVIRCFASSYATYETDVVIVGGGPTGLLLSNLLSQYKTPHILLESKLESECYTHPQAHYINLRSMEILRHCTPKVHEKVTKNLRPIQEWESFRFGTSVLSKKLLGKIKHGVLPKNIEKHPSACYVGHLAQNKFCKMLMDEARERIILNSNDINSSFLFGSEVTSVRKSVQHGDNVLKINYIARHQKIKSMDTGGEDLLKKEQNISCKFLVACDGAHSSIRKQFNVPMEGESAIQHLLNVYFRIKKGSILQCELEKRENCGMLHFIYNQKCIVVFVSHDVSEGEWVAQIPIFPPFSNTSDYTDDNIMELLYCGLFGSEHSEKMTDIDIISIRPWCMSSLVATSYQTGPNGQIFLAGDAAHTFPPAGGFGMNTGLQDAHNLAWKLAVSIKSSSMSLLKSYDDERRPIAMDNAALSVRNYERTLNIARSMGLDANYSSIAIQALESSPFNKLPFSVRKNLFQNMVKLAMLPLAKVEKDGFIQSFIARKIQGILDRCEGLPLLFPAFELGFSYKNSIGQRLCLGIESDNAQYENKLAEGYRLPHCEISLITQSSSTANIIKDIKSITDISTQIIDEEGKPIFAIVCPSSSFETKFAHVPVNKAFSLWVVCIHQATDPYFDDSFSCKQPSNNICNRTLHFMDNKGDWKNTVMRAFESSNIESSYDNSAVLVRPDGHVLKIYGNHKFNDEGIAMEVLDYINLFVMCQACDVAQI